MRIKINEDDLFPFYHIDKRFGVECCAPKGLVDKWDRVMDEFWEVQNEMAEIYKNTRKY